MRESILDLYGERQVEIGTIPYPEQYPGHTRLNCTLAEFVHAFERGDLSAFTERGSPRYVFENHFFTLTRKQLKAAATGEVLPVSFVTPDTLRQLKALPESLLSRLPKQPMPLQFFLGPPESGAPLHLHQSALNVLAYGRKRWFLYPPAEARTSTMPAAEWVQSGRGVERPGERPPLECVQHAGDVLFVPEDWSHATINLETSVGVATEFDVISPP